MLTGHSLVYFSQGPWDDLWRPQHQILSIFAKQNKVIYVERRPYLRSTVSELRRGELGWQDLRRPTLKKVAENLYLHRYPLWAPASGAFALKELSRTAMQHSLNRSMRSLGMSNPIVWYSLPSWGDLIDDLPSAKLKLYHAIDEYTSYSDMSEAKIRTWERLERMMMAKTDAVIVVSKTLYDAKSPYNPHTYLIPNAVNYQAYEAALADPELPPELAAIPKPRVGYIGLIGDKLNLPMLLDLARENPQWSLVFLGTVRLPNQEDLWQALVSLPNVHHLGAVDVSRVPDYVKGFQVGLMPNLQNLFAENCSPLKLYDYLAAGIPVASIDIPHARPFASHIHLASTPEDFGQAVRDALADTDPQRWQERREIAAQETWEARVDKLSDIIVERLSAIGARAA
jgi:hypothetical protein